MESENKELEIIDKRLKHDEQEAMIPESSPNALVMAAIKNKYTPELISQMMDLAERQEKNEARKAYHEAMAAFKAEAPEVKKDKYNKFFDSWYTSLGNLLSTYNPILGKHGLSLSHLPPEQTEKTMTVVCRLSHRMGHSESVPMTGPIDVAAIGKTSGQRSRNPMQDMKSTFTYLRSATVEAILGVSGTEASAAENNGNSIPDTTKFDEWIRLIDTAAEGTANDVRKFWKINRPAIEKDCGKTDAAKIYKMGVGHIKRIEAGTEFPVSDSAGEREPGEEG